MVLDNKGFIGLGNKKIKVSKVSDQVWFRQGSGLILVFWLCPPLCIGFVPMLVARELQRFQACQGHRTFISFLTSFVKAHINTAFAFHLPVLGHMLLLGQFLWPEEYYGSLNSFCKGNGIILTSVFQTEYCYLRTDHEIIFESSSFKKLNIFGIILHI